MSFPRYPKYKDSGVELLREVPAHWDVKRLKQVSPQITVGIVVEPSKYYVDEGIPALRSLNVGKKGEILEDNLVCISEEGNDLHSKSKLNAGDLVAVRSGKPGTTAVVSEKFDGCNCIDLIIIRKPIIGSEFFLYWFLGSDAALIQFVLGSGGAIQQHFNVGAAVNLVVPWPNEDDQSAIVAFLDTETAKIDALVAEQENLIALLKEKRQAVISHAVTKGLDPTVPMKDSGIEWLGEVPAHWDVAPLKRDLGFLTSGSRGWADHYADEGAIFIRIGNLTRGSLDLDLTDLQRVEVPEGVEGERTLVRPGDIIFSITAYLGSVAVIPAVLETAYVSQHVALARLARRLFNSHWVGYVTLSFIGATHFDTAAYGGTKIQLSLGDVADLPITTPPLKEQLQIVNYLETETAKLDTLTAEAQRAIDLLKERRSALISAAVTGKIDVRGYHAQSQPIV